MIDWTKPIETIDGKPVAIRADVRNSEGCHEVYLEGDLTSRTYRENGQHIYREHPNIRNAITIDAPNTFDEKATKVFARLLAVVETYHGYDTEARAILDALKPVSVDVLAARAVCGETLDEVADFATGECDGGEIMRCAVVAIAKGRQMQKDGE